MVSKRSLASPATGQACAGYGLVLRTRGLMGAGPVLSDSATCGLDIKLDDGRTVRVPEGRLRLEGAKRVSADGVALERHLAALDPKRGTDGEFGPFPFDEVCEAVVRDGDRVELSGTLAERPDTAALPASYRDRPEMVLVPVGVLAMRCL